MYLSKWGCIAPTHREMCIIGMTYIVKFYLLHTSHMRYKVSYMNPSSVEQDEFYSSFRYIYGHTAP